MPPLSHAPLPTRLLVRLIGPYFAIASATAAATDVWVVTDQHHPVTPFQNARVIKLGATARIETELDTALPHDPQRAAALARQRLAQGGPGLQRRLQSAYQGVLDAWRLGVAKLPAVVVDRRYVVYGEHDVARAVSRIEAWRRRQP